jgi:hypothetical protein
MNRQPQDLMFRRCAQRREELSGFAGVCWGGSFPAKQTLAVYFGPHDADLARQINFGGEL